MPYDGTPDKIPIVAVADAMRKRYDALLKRDSVEWAKLPPKQRLFWYELALAGVGEWLYQVHSAQKREIEGPD
jgi:hypothetical protein